MYSLGDVVGRGVGVPSAGVATTLAVAGTVRPAAAGPRAARTTRCMPRGCPRARLMAGSRGQGSGPWGAAGWSTPVPGRAAGERSRCSARLGSASGLGRATSRVLLPGFGRQAGSGPGSSRRLASTGHQGSGPLGPVRQPERSRSESDGCLQVRGPRWATPEGRAMAVVTMRQLLESGVHFGHQTRRWNPKMKRFIFTERNGIYIVDLQQSLSYIDSAYEFVKETVARGGTILFVGTKRQAQEPIAEQASRVGMPYVNHRW